MAAIQQPEGEQIHDVPRVVPFWFCYHQFFSTASFVKRVSHASSLSESNAKTGSGQLTGKSKNRKWAKLSQFSVRSPSNMCDAAESMEVIGTVLLPPEEKASACLFSGKFNNGMPHFP
jgi:hypothetical protein